MHSATYVNTSSHAVLYRMKIIACYVIAELIRLTLLISMHWHFKTDVHRNLNFVIFNSNRY